jgi:hypothetical protein
MMEKMGVALLFGAGGRHSADETGCAAALNGGAADLSGFLQITGAL